MNESMFQNVFDILIEVMPQDWDKVIFYAGYAEGSYGMKFYTKLGNMEYVDCFSQQEADEEKLMMAFMKIDNVLSPVREQLDDANRWNVLTMMVDSQGHMKTEFDYEDISERMIEYEREWEKKYLL